MRAERDAEVGEGVEWLTRERPTGTAARQLTLGNRIAVDRIVADFSDGVLTLTIPVSEEAKPRKISISHSGNTTSAETATHNAPLSGSSNADA